MKDVTYTQYLEAVDVLRRYKIELKWRMNEIDKHLESLPCNSEIDENTLFSEVKYSVKLYNVLSKNQTRLGILFNKNTTLSELGKIKITHFLRIMSVGEATVKELKELCRRAKVKLQP